MATKEQPVWKGRVFVSEKKLPENVNAQVIGVVRAEARAGYAHSDALFPRLAQEARKIGANAVVDASGGHQVKAFSWAAPYASGTAVRVDDMQQLGKLSGKYYSAASEAAR